MKLLTTKLHLHTSMDKVTVVIIQIIKNMSRLSDFSLIENYL